ncbi:DUF1642 domain-containing protein [Lacticaseibacillus paracasei]|uniref:DUF1642 domain-containing protein n=1 Tax=Lacticaseibacillus paracasei TaxID=1597 RepID=UPI0025A0E414|nr:DUF1642 domain-containing protein [Lacticaseibacillus paracasei]MDM7550587.1 DUF1642 domain-containing protein [Lacticaseibacillus paracasei]
MSEEKLYAVKNDEGEWLNQYCFWGPETWAKPDKDDREKVAKHYGGHVVAFVEEPEKVVVSPEEAKLVKNCLWTNLQDAFLNNINLLFRGRRPEDVTRLKSALTNGYTVAKEKKYIVKVPHTSFYYWKKLDGGLSVNDLVANDKYDAMKFTEAEIEHYGLQDCEKEEVTDDDD